MKTTVAAAFSKYDQAERAADQLIDEGVERDALSIMASGPDGGAPAESELGQTASRIRSGALVGGVAGAVLGVTALAIPGLGPLLAAGPLASALLAGGGGAATGGLLGALTGAGLDRDTAEYYASGVEQGGAIVVVETDPERAAHWEKRLRDLDARDVRTGGAGTAADREMAFIEASDVSERTETLEGTTVRMYEAEAITPPGTGFHQEATGDAQDVADACDTRVKTDSGPEFFAPRNERFTSSFDEPATIADDPVRVLDAEAEDSNPHGKRPAPPTSQPN
jgi:hypothetical protein